ncbi:MAG: PEP-CTERM sorting domain-containing protein [Chthonomonadetes bacterium]|nr:PEP-CTERM sorting domain-containing protein [Chthonomonadetes bacterium]
MLFSMCRKLGLISVLSLLLVNAAYSYTLLNSIVWPGNGHLYQVYGGSSSWVAAAAFAGTVSVPGFHNGYLATVHSEAENNVITSLLTLPAWLGGYQPEGELAPNANWRWVTGEPWTYTNWYPGQPNDNLGPGSEQYLVIYTNGMWHDYPNGTRPSFVVELNPVPDPASIAGLGVGVAGLFLRRRKR